MFLLVVYETSISHGEFVHCCCLLTISLFLKLQPALQVFFFFEMETLQNSSIGFRSEKHQEDVGDILYEYHVDTQRGCCYILVSKIQMSSREDATSKRFSMYGLTMLSWCLRSR